MAKKFYDMTPYKYGMNNPILYTDPDGNCEICDAFIGFTVAVLDNAFGTNVRDNFNQTPTFVQATKTGDAASVVTGALLMVKGIEDTGAGAAGMAGSIGVTFGSGGTATIATGPAFAGSAALTGLGIGEYWLGGNMVLNASKRTYSSSEEGSSSGSSSDSGKMSGSGPTDGVLEVSNSRKSSAQFKNYNPKNATEFVFDPSNNRFVVGKPKNSTTGLSPHQNLAKLIHGDKNVVGGMFKRGANGEILTNEMSGHFHENWTPEIRAQFQSFLKNQTGQNMIHTSGPTF